MLAKLLRVASVAIPAVEMLLPGRARGPEKEGEVIRIIQDFSDLPNLSRRQVEALVGMTRALVAVWNAFQWKAEGPHVGVEGDGGTVSLESGGIVGPKG